MAQSRIPKLTSSVHDVNEEKPPFGSRFLTDETDVWSQNAWDHVPPPSDQADKIAASIARQRLAPVPEADKPKYNEKPAKHWDNFYKMNNENFFRNRKWLHLEFPDLVAASQPQAGPLTIAEIGCGAGNAVFPLLSANKNPLLTLLAYDYSSHAVKLVQHNPLYINPPMGSIHAVVWDLTSSSLPDGLDENSVDVIVLVFVLSALHPDEWRQAVANIHRILKPGGRVLVRDYGRHDLTQLRFKGGRLLDDNFYIRGDKTRVYFFELDELALMFTGARAAPSETAVHTSEIQEEVADEAPDTSDPIQSSDPSSQTGESLSDSPSELDAASSPSLDSQPPSIIHPNLLGSDGLAPFPPNPLFAAEQLGIDRRLIVNRKRQLKMYRVWMQGKFRKL